ncbi:MAG: hypothetical protein ACKVP3_08030, partial [Hyphomicrobiaceae bacterium]
PGLASPWREQYQPGLGTNPRAGLETATGRANHREMIGIVRENAGSGQAEYSLGGVNSAARRKVVPAGHSIVANP